MAGASKVESTTKKPLTPFFLFRAEVYEKVKTDNPTSKVADLAKIIGEMWSKVDEEVKSRYHD